MKKTTTMMKRSASTKTETIHQSAQKPPEFRGLFCECLMHKSRFKIGSSIYFVRGLTVGEMLELADTGAFDIGSTSEYARVFAFVRCVEDVWNVSIRDYKGNKVRKDQFNMVTFDINEHSVEELPDEHLVKVGGHILEEISLLSEEKEQKLRGLTRFKFWFSDDKRKDQLETFNCATCIGRGLDNQRKCGLSEYQKDIIRDSLSDEDEQTKSDEEERKELNEKMRRALARTASRRRRRVSLNPRSKKEQLKAQGHFSIYGFIFPECPMSWVDAGLRRWSDVLYYSYKNGVSFTVGQFLDQPNVLWNAAQVVAAEAAEMESKMMEEIRGK